MKKGEKWILMILLSIVIVSCKKKNDIPAEPDKPISGVVRTEHGKAIGNPSKKVIGSDGGTLSVPDSKVKLTIPAGALDIGTEFSIQEVEYTLPYGGVGKAYRFLPENVTFKKDVEITIPYGQLKNTSSKALRLTYQDQKGYWRVAKNCVVSDYQETVTTKTRHFSDWGVLAQYYIKILGKAELGKGESTELQACFLPTLPEPDNGDLLLPEAKLTDANIDKWQTGSSEIKISGGQSMLATVSVPGVIKSMGSISVEVVLKDMGTPMTLKCFILLLTEQYCRLAIGGVELGLDEADVFSGDQMSVNFYGNYKAYRFHVEAPDQAFGQKLFGENKAFVSTYLDRDYYASSYTKCGAPDAYYTTGDIVVIDVKDGFVYGDSQGELRRKIPGTPYCYGDPVMFTARFRYKKK